MLINWRTYFKNLLCPFGIRWENAFVENLLSEHKSILRNRKKRGDWKCKYGKRKYWGMEYASTENLSTIGKGGKCKYGKRKYRIAWVENASTENASTNLQEWKT